jgi:hypothetical protein
LEAKKELFEAAKDLLSAKLHVRKILPDPKVFAPYRDLLSARLQ